MNRRESVLALIAFGAAPTLENALAQARPLRIGVLGPRPRSVLFPAALKRLGELGYVEGRNIVVEYRSAQGVVERFPALARELIEANCDLIFAVGAEHPARALLEAKTTIPVVILAHDYDPVRAGIVSNLRRPGGNVTGMVNPEAAVAAKRVELLRETLPKTRRFLLLADRFSRDQFEAVHQAARRIRVELVTETFATPPYDYEAAFAKGRASGIDAVVLLDSPVFADQGSTISQFLLKHRLPAASFVAVVDEPGFLIGYGIDATRAYAPAGDIAARILKGTKPGDIAVEQVTEYEFVVNLRTAKAFGMSIPQSIAVRADRAIQ